MKRKQRTILPHEPDQPTAGIAEAVRDSDAMLRIWKKKERRAVKALQRLQKAGMKVLVVPPLDPKRKRRKTGVKRG